MNYDLYKEGYYSKQGPWEVEETYEDFYSNDDYETCLEIDEKRMIKEDFEIVVKIAPYLIVDKYLHLANDFKDELFISLKEDDSEICFG